MENCFIIQFFTILNDPTEYLHMLNSHIGQNILILVIILVDSITFSVLIWCLSKGLSSVTTLVMI